MGAYEHKMQKNSEERKWSFHKHHTCFSSGDGQDVTGVTGARAVLCKHADVVGRRVHLYQGGLGLISTEVDRRLGVVPRGFWGVLMGETTCI